MAAGQIGNREGSRNLMPGSASAELEPYLRPTWFIDSEHPTIVEFARETVGDGRDETARALRLFYAVRDGIRYTAYGIRIDRASFRASNTLASGRGWCVTKSCLLAAAARAQRIPCRLGYATVRNHLATRKLLEMMGTDLFYYHGYNEFFLGGRWIKATVAFNASLCEKAGLKPLDWDGRHDSLYHSFDVVGNRHMEYVDDYGPAADVPYEAIVSKFSEVYPLEGVFEALTDAARAAALAPSGDFEAEIEAEAKRAPCGRERRTGER
jgi:transglutaminase-like putative cysteine protease